MGGKTLKFPKRGKFVPQGPKVEEKKQEVSAEEHAKRLDMLKSLGLVK